METASAFRPYRLQSMLKNASGMSRTGLLLVVLFISAGVFIGSQVLPFYYYYHELLGMMEAQARKASVFTDQEIRQTLLAEIKKLEIPIESPDELKVNRFNNKIVIELSYQEVLFLDLGGDRVYDLYVFEFNPRVEQPL